MPRPVANIVRACVCVTLRTELANLRPGLSTFNNRTVLRVLLRGGSISSSGLAHVEAGDGAADDQALDL